MKTKLLLLLCTLTLCLCTWAVAEEAGTACTEHEWDWGNYQYDENQHWIACAYCGAVEVTGICRHVYDDWSYDENAHWHVCTICGEILDYDVHSVNCDGSKSWCSGCHDDGVGGEIHHDLNWLVPVMNDEYYHQFYEVNPPERHDFRIKESWRSFCSIGSVVN